MTYKAQAYHIKCIYQTGEQNVTLGFNVSMLTTAGTIANTGPPPVCLMKIVTQNGNEINSAEIGDNLMLQVEVQPSSEYRIVKLLPINSTCRSQIITFVFQVFTVDLLETALPRRWRTIWRMNTS